MPQLDTSTWPTQLIWLAITFCALYYIISQVVIPRTGGVIALRKSTVEGDLAAAQKLKAETEAALTAYDAAMAAARNKAQGIAKDNREKVTAEIDGERAKLDAELGAKIEAADKVIATARGKAMTEVEGIAADIAASIVSALTGVNATPAAVKDAIGKAAK